MKTKELIEIIQTLDPSGETDITGNQIKVLYMTDKICKLSFELDWYVNKDLVFKGSSSLFDALANTMKSNFRISIIER